MSRIGYLSDAARHAKYLMHEMRRYMDLFESSDRHDWNYAIHVEVAINDDDITGAGSDMKAVEEAHAGRVFGFELSMQESPEWQMRRLLANMEMVGATMKDRLKQRAMRVMQRFEKPDKPLMQSDMIILQAADRETVEAMLDDLVNRWNIRFGSRSVSVRVTERIDLKAMPPDQARMYRPSRD